MTSPPRLVTKIFLNSVFAAACVLAISCGTTGTKTIAAAEPPVDPVHAAHVKSGAMPPDAAKGDPALAQQVSQLQARITQLEATLAKNAPQVPGVAPVTTGAMPGMAAPTAPMAGMSSGAQAVAPPAGGMGGMAAKPAGGMGGMAAKPAGGMGGMPGGPADMMAMMDKMMGMMDKMMPMAGGMPPAAPMAGGDMGMAAGDMSGMGGAMPPAAPMAGGGMDAMAMAGMMGKGAAMNASAGPMPQSALPGFPGASHLYHIGSTGFFLDHPQHITLTTEQQAALNKARVQALLAKESADRSVAQAEQDLWMLTAADQPDVASIAIKIAEIGKISGDERLAFIRSVGEASKILSDQQRQSLTGFAPPVPSNPMAPAAAMPPAAAPMTGGMKGM